MSAVPKLRMTVAEYLAFEGTSEVRHEFFNGELFAMAGASPEHNTLKDNLVGELYMRLKGGPCRTYSSDQRVKVSATGLYTYPDLVIVCGRAEFAPEDRNTLVNPQVVIEVLSPGTEVYDRGTKFRHYQKLPSVQEYVLVSQDQALAERYVRQPDGTWSLTNFSDPAGEFALASVPVRIPLSDVYRGVEFPEQHPDQAT